MSAKQEKTTEERTITALEKIADSLDALTLWFEEIDKEDWDSRIQHYLAQWHKSMFPGEHKDD